MIKFFCAILLEKYVFPDSLLNNTLCHSGILPISTLGGGGGIVAYFLDLEYASIVFCRNVGLEMLIGAHWKYGKVNSVGMMALLSAYFWKHVTSWSWIVWGDFTNCTNVCECTQAAYEPNGASPRPPCLFPSAKICFVGCQELVPSVIACMFCSWISTSFVGS